MFNYWHRCNEEYIEVRNGGTENSKLINKFCVLPDSLFTTDNLMYVKFFTDRKDPSNGFKAKISIGWFAIDKCDFYILFLSRQLWWNN